VLPGQIVDRFERGQAHEVGRDAPVVQKTAVIADGAVDFQAVFQSG
jgi:hypothetical protein